MADSHVPLLALAVVQGHAIFLDCWNDRFFALSPVENEAVLRLLAGERVPAGRRRAIAAAIGIDVDADSLRALLPAAAGAGEARRYASSTPGGWLTSLAAVRHLAGATAMLRLRGFHASMARVARTRPRGADEGPGASKRIGHVTAAHRWLSRHHSANEACLVRSLALAQHARLSGCPVQLVVGVKANPFAAHCWVEWNARILNDEPDAVAAFQPILVVR